MIATFVDPFGTACTALTRWPAAVGARLAAGGLVTWDEMTQGRRCAALRSGWNIGGGGMSGGSFSLVVHGLIWHLLSLVGFEWLCFDSKVELCSVWQSLDGRDPTNRVVSAGCEWIVNTAVTGRIAFPRAGEFEGTK